MTLTLQQDRSPESLDLIAWAHQLGIRIWWRAMHGLDGAWSCPHRSIWVRPGLTEAETRSILAHELAHAELGHDGPQLPAAEDRAWRHAATLLISREQYADAEAIYGPNAHGLAEALNVTVDIVHAYREHLVRNPE